MSKMSSTKRSSDLRFVHEQCHTFHNEPKDNHKGKTWDYDEHGKRAAMIR